MLAVLSSVSSEYALVPIDLSFYAPLYVHEFVLLLYHVYAYEFYHAVSFPTASMLLIYALYYLHTTDYFP
jgi:hypothetical protein